jgi:prephenate dehydrogenase
MASTRITLVGCGPTGILLGLAIKAADKSIEIIAHDRERSEARDAIRLKAADREEWNLPKACTGAALVLVTAPPDQAELTLDAIGPVLTPGATVCVVGGSNVALQALAAKHLPESIGFVSSSLVLHPALADAPMGPERLKGAMWSLVGRGAPEQLGGFAGFVESLGARPLFVDPLERDGMAIAVDVLPQALAGILMATVSKDIAWRERLWAAGADFGAATAAAVGAPALVDAMLTDKATTVHWLNELMRECMALRDEIAAGDGDAARARLAQAAEQREKWFAEWRKGRESGAPPVDQQQGGRSIMGLFLGQRMADMLSRKPRDGK